MKLGLVGSSAGNGHPYSWSAILNGYDRALMQKCPFPVIPKYLSSHEISPGSLGAQVTHVWCQDHKEAQQVAAASHIPNVADSLDYLLSEVDGVLHARDDYVNHAAFAAQYTAAGLPVFIDKPLATSRALAASILALDPSDELIFTCSALRYAPELDSFLSIERNLVRHVEAIGPKDWQRYAVHLIDPAVRVLSAPGPLLSWSVSNVGASRSATFTWQGDASLVVRTTGLSDTPFTLRVGDSTIRLSNTYESFRRALEQFVRFCTTRQLPIARSNTLRVIELIERGDE